MSQIKLVFDNKLKKPQIEIPLTNSSREEAGENYTTNWQQIQQTSIYGIKTPLIQINDVVIDFIDVNSFNLKSTGPLPQLDIEVRDRYNLIATISTPSLDNQITVQIIPPFDNAYKKINLLFNVSNMVIKGDIIRLSGVYKLPKLLCSNFKSFGEINTYNLFKEIATDTELGFASNTEQDDTDKRYIYCDNSNYIEVMNREIQRSHSDSTHIYDYWIDYWDNLNYVNIYDRYNSKDPEEEMMIWISGQPHEMEEGETIAPIQIKSIINNHPLFKNSDLNTNTYEIITKTGSYIGSGTDKVYSIFEEDKQEYLDYLIQDGDVKNDIYIKYEYLGEVYGSYNYLLASACRAAYIQKLSVETIKVTLKTPLLALMRGHNVEFIWYINDDNWRNKMQSLSDSDYILENKDIKNVDDLSAPDDIEGYNSANGEFIIDKSVSGQYTIISCNMRYYLGEWFYDLILTRPHTNNPIIKKENNNES